MPAASSTRSSSIVIVASWLAFLWAVFVADVILRAAHIIDLAMVIGLRPRTKDGLWGIAGSHILHANLEHIVSNSVGLLVLGLTSCWYSQRLTAWAVFYAAICSGTLTWLIAPAGSVHIGASGVLFGLVGFLVFNGLFRRSWGAFFLALLIGVLASGIVPGMLPTAENAANLISWQMHLGGFIGGAIASWQLRREKAV
ncbi:MAG: rhomboid family intramembrane serine protease [Planctomycetes bacterium]|nr:rhomboid family intramembrane serine protease [Planctomycetota bacterium]